MIAPLQCVSCNAPRVVVDASSVTCAFCGATNLIPQQYRDELCLTRELDDAWVLAICVFWYVREVFLPPATIQELETLIDGRIDSPTASRAKTATTSAAGTRVWYDRAFEKRNFAIPATVALMFLAIELLVLNG